MRKYSLYLLIFLVALASCESKVDFTTPATPAGQTTDLMISEISTAINTDPLASGARPHYVEIYNGTGSSKNLGDYAIGYFAVTDTFTLSNFSFNTATSFILTGTLATGKCYVIASPQTDAVTIKRDTVWGTLSTTAANASTPLQLSGNSGIALLKKDGAGTHILNGNAYKVIDVFGSPLVGRVNSKGATSARNNIIWTIAGETVDTRNRTFWRKANVTSPTTDWAAAKGTTAGDSQWTISGDRAWSYLNIGLPTQ